MTSLDDTPSAPVAGDDPGPPADPAPEADGTRRLARRRAERRARTERRAGTAAALVSGTGRVLITAGLLVLGFVAFQLWGTNLLNAREQRALRDDFTEQLEAAGLALPDGVPTADELAVAAELATGTTVPPTAVPTTAAPATPASTAPVTTTTAAPVIPVGLAPTVGEAVAAVQIPTIGVEQFVVEGVTRDDLRKGPGHYPSTPLPGQPGNAAVAGHRTTHGAPFNRLDELVVGDPIVVTTLNGIYTYRVTDSFVVDPSDVSVLDPVPDQDTLTLTTCTPEFSARQRLVVRAELVPSESSPLTLPSGEEVPADEAPAELPGDDTATSTPVDDTAVETAPTTAAPTATTAPDVAVDHSVETVEELEAFSPPGTAFYLLALVLMAVGAAWWWAFRRRRRVTTWAVGVVPFLVALFLFYVQVELILPAGY